MCAPVHKKVVPVGRFELPVSYLPSRCLAAWPHRLGCGADGVELNPRPPAYKAGALPLSYASMPAVNWLVLAAGIELATSRLRSERSTGLSYASG